MKRIVVFTSGSDAPGMNACVRAVVRSAHYFNLEVFGALKGFDGLMDGEFIEMNDRSVSNIIQKGGTILKCSRSERIKSKEGRREAFEKIKIHSIDALVAIGDKETFQGAHHLYQEYGIPSIGIPGTIDNDIYGTDFTIGYDTAVNTALSAIDQLRDTADSHERVFLIEVMGKDSGHITVWSAIAGGAEMALLPVKTISIENIIQNLSYTIHGTKRSHIIIVAEDNELGKTQFICDSIKSRLPSIDARITTLGHVQRGGQPSAADRVLASQLGIGAIEGIAKGIKNSMIGIINGCVQFTSLAEVISKEKEVQDDLIKMIEILNGRCKKNSSKLFSI